MSGNRIVVFGQEARDRVISGVRKLTKTVAVTMGPRGRNVIIQKEAGAPVITKDGVSVARQVVCKDPLEEIGCQLVKEVAGRTVDLAGDGTTTATVLTHGIIATCLEGLSKNEYTENDLKKASGLVLQQLLTKLDELALPVDNNYQTLKDIAIISTNNDVAFGTIIADAFRQADYTGTVLAEAVPGHEDKVREVNGLELKSGYASPGFLKNGTATVNFNRCPIMIIGEEAEALNEETIRIFTEVVKNKMPLLILAKKFTSEFLANIVNMRMHSGAHVCLVQIPTLGNQNLEQDDWIDNLSVMTSASVIGKSRGLPLENVTFDHLGYAESVEVGRLKTNIVKPKRNIAMIEKRLEDYQGVLGSPAYSEKAKADVKERMSFLRSKTTIISVGYTTEFELREKGDRFDDAISAARAALEEGVVPGGGFALVRIANDVISDNEFWDAMTSEERAAGKRYLSALYHPAFTILDNARIDSKSILEEYLKQLKNETVETDRFFGYNSSTETFGNLKELGVIDPKKVTRVALENATSIAILMLTTEAVIAEDPDDGAGWQPPAGWRIPSNTNFDHKY